VKLVVGQGGCVSERLSNILLLEVWQFRDNLRWRHTVRDEVDDMGDRDAKAADCCAPSQHARILRDAIELVRHVSIMPPWLENGGPPGARLGCAELLKSVSDYSPVLVGVKAPRVARTLRADGLDPVCAQASGGQLPPAILGVGRPARLPDMPAHHEMPSPS